MDPATCLKAALGRRCSVHVQVEEEFKPVYERWVQH